jgi:DNA-binding transcriptional LysR family regulator
MTRPSLNDLSAFVAVARAGSFTKAAAQLGVSQPALSQTLRNLEAKLGTQLLMRTTRSVSPTPAGERLLLAVAGRIEEIELELDVLADQRGRPGGQVRITVGEHALTTLVWPKLVPLLREYPDIHIEFDVSYGLKDIVAERFDAGIRMGEQVEKDMIAIPIGPPARMAVVGSPAYLSNKKLPRKPQDLDAHQCINLRLPTHGGAYAWEFERHGRETRARVNGQLTFSAAGHVIEAALDGFGLACVPEDMVMPYLAQGRLVRMLEDWCPPFPGYHLYYPSRRHPSPAFRLVMEALRAA